MADNSSQHLRRTNTVAGELHQIQAYVEQTNNRVQYLEELLEPPAYQLVSDIKRGLEDAHKGLERLAERFRVPGIDTIILEVGAAYRRTSGLEERLKKGKDASPTPTQRDVTPASIEEKTTRRLPIANRQLTPMNFHIQKPVEVVTQEQTRFYRSYDEGEGDDDSFLAIPSYDGASTTDSDTLSAVSEAERWYKQGQSYNRPLPSRRPSVVEEEESVLTPKASVQSSMYSEVAFDTLMKGLQLEVSPQTEPARRTALTNDHYVPGPVHRCATSQTDSHDVVSPPKTVHFPVDLARSREEIIEDIDWIEKTLQIQSLYDPDRRREGSADGYRVSILVMRGLDDPRMIIPELRFMKVHEVRDLKAWLDTGGYLQKAKDISKTEKLLHLVILLQCGGRFETIAIMFSRTPRQVKRYVSRSLLKFAIRSLMPLPAPAWKFSVVFCRCTLKRNCQLGMRSSCTHICG